MLLWAELKKMNTVLSVLYAKVNVLYAFVSVWSQGRGQGIPLAHASNRWRIRNLTFKTEGGGI